MRNSSHIKASHINMNMIQYYIQWLGAHIEEDSTINMLLCDQIAREAKKWS